MINMYTTYYYTLLQQLLLHCYLYCFIELLAILILCFKTRVKMLVFDRLSTFPLTLVLLSNSPLYNLFFHFDTSCILLSSLGLSLPEYARYSPLLYYSFFALPDRPLQSTLEPRSRRSPMSTTTM